MDIHPAAAEGTSDSAQSPTESLCALEGGRFSLDLCPFFTFQMLEAQVRAQGSGHLAFGLGALGEAGSVVRQEVAPSGMVLRAHLEHQPRE